MDLELAKILFPKGTPVIVYPFLDENGNKSGTPTKDVVSHEPALSYGSVCVYLHRKGLFDCDFLTPNVRHIHIKYIVDQLISQAESDESIIDAISIESIIKALLIKAMNSRLKIEELKKL